MWPLEGNVLLSLQTFAHFITFTAAWPFFFFPFPPMFHPFVLHLPVCFTPFLSCFLFQTMSHMVQLECCHTTTHLSSLNQNNEASQSFLQCLNNRLSLKNGITCTDHFHSSFLITVHLPRKRGIYKRWYSALPKFRTPNGVSTWIAY